MTTCTEPARDVQPATRNPIRASLFVLLAIGLPILSGLIWHRESDNPVWPLVRNSLDRCELRDSPLSPLSPDGVYRVRVVQATCLGRFTETLVFVTGSADRWQPERLDPNRAVLEAAGWRSLDAIDWHQAPGSKTPSLLLWLAPGASPHQIHRLASQWHGIGIQSRISSPAFGGHLDY